MLDLTIHHLCIQTNDYTASLQFYCQVLGAKLVKETPNFHNRAFNSWLQLPNLLIELQTPKQPSHFHDFSKTTQGIAHFCFLVPDVTLAVAQIQATGYHHFQTKNKQIIYDVEGSLLAKIIAPEGTIIELRDQAQL
ncbi:MAG: VOC family protein [Culicoidibacterales bacterium]